MQEVNRGGEPPSPGHVVGFGAELRRRREAAGLSQADLARLINYDRTLISKAEHGAELPSAAFAEATDRALDAGGALAALAPVPMPADLAALVPADDSTMRWLRDALYGLRRVEHLAPPAPLIAVLRGHLDTIRRKRQDAPEPIRRDLIGLAAEYADTLSGLSQEANDVAGAARWRERSVEWALQAGPAYRDFVTYTNTCRSSLAYWQKDAAGALDAARAVRYSDGPVPLTLLAGGAHYEARALSLLGDEAGCMTRLEECVRLAELAEGQESPWFKSTINGFRSTVEFDALAAVCLIDLGHGARAAEVMARGLAASQRLSVGRSQHVSMCRLARAYEAAGEFERAAETGMAAIAPAARSGARNTIAELCKLRTRLMAAAGALPAVRDLDTRLRTTAPAA